MTLWKKEHLMWHMEPSAASVMSDFLKGKAWTSCILRFRLSTSGSKCSLENGMCSWINIQDREREKLDWELTSPEKEKHYPVPPEDHTLGTEKGQRGRQQHWSWFDRFLKRFCSGSNPKSRFELVPEMLEFYLGLYWCLSRFKKCLISKRSPWIVLDIETVLL